MGKPKPSAETGSLPMGMPASRGIAAYKKTMGEDQGRIPDMLHPFSRPIVVNNRTLHPSYGAYLESITLTPP